MNNGNQAASLQTLNNHPKTSVKKKGVRCFAVASGKGGVGKTFISVNLALAFHKFNKKVLLVDADLGLANTDIVLGVNPRFTLQDSLFKGKNLNDIVTHTPFGIDLLTASSGTKEMVKLGEVRMSQFIEDLIRFATNYDVLLFDCASGINSSVTSFIAAAPESIIVSTSQPTSIMDAYALLKTIYQDNLCRNLNMIINMVESDKQGQRTMDTLNYVTQNFLSESLDLVGIIPISKQAYKAVQSRKPMMIFDEDDPVSQRLKSIAKTILMKSGKVSDISNINVKEIVNGMLKI